MAMSDAQALAAVRQHYAGAQSSAANDATQPVAQPRGNSQVTSMSDAQALAAVKAHYGSAVPKPKAKSQDISDSEALQAVRDQ